MNRTDDKLIINYNDVCIYNSDLQLLQSKSGTSSWLNDTCIHYHMKRLESSSFVLDTSWHSPCNGSSTTNSNDDDDDDDDGSDKKRGRLPDKPSKMSLELNKWKSPSSLCKISNVEYLDPSIISFFMHQLSIDDEDDQDELKQICQPWLTFDNGPISKSDENNVQNENEGKNQVNIIFLPINDNHAATLSSFQQPGSGNHWSLLVLIMAKVQKENGAHHSSIYPSTLSSPGIKSMFFHFDSSKGMNASSATSVSKKVNEMISIFTADYTSQKFNGKRTKYQNNPVIECITPQQQNGYDCGIHTLAAASAIREEFIRQKNGVLHVKNLHFKFPEKIENDMKEQLEESIQTFIFGKKCDGSVDEMTKAMRRNIVMDIQNFCCISICSKDQP